MTAKTTPAKKAPASKRPPVVNTKPTKRLTGVTGVGMVEIVNDPKTGATVLPAKNMSQKARVAQGIADVLNAKSDKAAKAIADQVVADVYTPEAIAAMSMVDRLAVVKVERHAVQMWKAGSPTGNPDPTTRPATPVLNWMNNTPANVRQAKQASTTSRTSSRPSKRIEANKALAGTTYVHGGHTAVINDDGTWTVTRADGKVVANLKSATAASCAAEAPKLRSATGYWQTPGTTAVEVVVDTPAPKATPKAKATAKPAAKATPKPAAKKAPKPSIAKATNQKLRTAS